MNFNSKLILITGANGWLGRNLVESLVNSIPNCSKLEKIDSDVKIRCMVMPNEEISFFEEFSDRIELFTGNIQSIEDCLGFLNGADGATLFHTAGIIHPNKIKQFYDINFEGTKNLLEASIKMKLKRFIAVSSNSPIGTNPNEKHLFDEKSPYNPYMNYGKSKMEMEKIIDFHAQQGDLETVIIRPPWFYGPHQPDRQILFFRMIRDGKGPIVGSGNNLRSMAYVVNICQGLILAGLSEKAIAQKYWIADKTPYTMNQIIDTIENILEEEFQIACKKTRLKLPSLVSEVAYLSDYVIQKIGLYNQKVHVLSEMNKNIACSINKARNELGYEPSISLKEGMIKSIRPIIHNL